MIAAYAEAERNGVPKRASNKRKLDAAAYARRLVYDGVKVGWLP